MPRDSFFLAAEAHGRLKAWKYAVFDNSPSTKLLTPMWNFLVKLVPKSIAPNVLTLGSALSAIVVATSAVAAEREYVAAQGTSNAGALYTFICFLGVFSYLNLDAIDGKHARATGQSSPLGEYWDHACDACAGPIVAIAAVPLAFGVTSDPARWFCALTFITSFRTPHVEALWTKVLTFSEYFDSGEAFCVTMALLLLRVCRGNAPIIGTLIPASWEVPIVGVVAAQHLVLHVLALWSGVRSVAHKRENAPAIAASCRQLLYCSLIDFCAFGLGLGLSTGAITLPAQLGVATWTGHYAFGNIGPMYGVCVCSSVATCDAILAKMASRPVLRSLPLSTLALLAANFLVSWQWGVALSVGYQLTVVFAVCDALGLPLLRKATHVYIDGVFDMMHEGHFVFSKKASTYGDKLVVGLGSDEVCAGYKRPPIMTEAERRRALLCLPWVSTIVYPKDFGEIDTDFLRANFIDVVVHGEEYDLDKNPEFKRRVDAGLVPDYFRPVRESGGEFKEISLPRTDGISTSDILGRIASRVREGDVDQRKDGGAVTESKKSK